MYFQHAYALEILKDRLIEGERALDIGSGSGYLTACMAIMLGENGMAVGIDHIPELVENAVKNVKTDNPELLTSGRLVLESNILVILYFCPGSFNKSVQFFQLAMDV